MKEFDTISKSANSPRKTPPPNRAESLAGGIEKTARVMEKSLEVGGSVVKEGIKAGKKTTSILHGAAERLWNNILDPNIDTPKKDK